MSENNRSIAALLKKANEQGYLLHEDLLTYLPTEVADSAPDLERVISRMQESGIGVFETQPTEEELRLKQLQESSNGGVPDEDNIKESILEIEINRTTDTVRMYMREMGTVELLTREGEIVIAKRIEEGIREVMQAMAYYPGIVESVLAIYDRIQADEGRMSDLLAGFLDPDPEDVAPTEVASTEDVNDQDFDDADADDEP